MLERQEGTETFTATCSKSHRRSEPEELLWLHNKASSCPEHVTEKRHRMNSAQHNTTQHSTAHPFQHCIETLHSCALSAALNTLHVSVHQSARWRMRPLIAFPMCQNKLWRTKKPLPCLKESCQVLVNVERRPVEFILIVKCFFGLFIFLYELNQWGEGPESSPEDSFLFTNSQEISN